MTYILTHRGLDPSKKDYFAESSREAFANQLERGYGLEFDALEHEGSFVAAHDADFSRITKNGCHIISLGCLAKLIVEKQSTQALSSFHLKSRVQDKSALDRILPLLPADPSKFIIFDVKIETAEYLKKKNPGLQLAPSVAHPHDIERYNAVVGGTLYTVEEVLKHQGLFDWVWLDEWDTKDRSGEKKFYTKEVFKQLCRAGLKIALVTPELHATSPGLLGGEVHEDARNYDSLMNRIREILALKPDAVCTDYPDAVGELIKNL